MGDVHMAFDGGLIHAGFCRLQDKSIQKLVYTSLLRRI
jgi:hypothetical protein